MLHAFIAELTITLSVCVCTLLCIYIHVVSTTFLHKFDLVTSSYKVKFVQERGVVRLWEVARFDFLLPRN